MKYIFILITIINSAEATEYFLSPDGNDGNIGSLESPWKSLSHGFQMISEGDTLYLREGVYRLIEEVNLSTINKPNLTLASYQNEDVEILGSYQTPLNAWEAYDENIWRTPADVLINNPKGMFLGHQRIDHQTDLDGGRDHDHVKNLTVSNHWTKADINGNQCFSDNTGCYIYLYPAEGQAPNSNQYELSQRSLARVASNGNYMTVRDLKFYYTQSSPIFFEGADFVTLENNTFAHTSNGNDNSYAVRIWDSEGSIVRGNKVFDSEYWGGTSNSKGISFMVTKLGEPNIVEYNEIYDIPGRSAVGTKGGTSNLIVRYNYIHDVFNAFEPGSFRCVWSSTNNDGCQSSDSEYRPAGQWQIYGNIVTNTEVGIRLPGFDVDNDNNKLYNNVFYQVKTAVELGWDGVFGLEIANNIFINNEVGIYLQSGGTTTTVNDYLDQYNSHHNIFYNNTHADIHLRPNWNGNYYSGTPYSLTTIQNDYSSESQSLIANPLFIDLISFRLLEGSPAIDTGDASLWPESVVNIGAHPFTSFTDIIFTDGFE